MKYQLLLFLFVSIHINMEAQQMIARKVPFYYDLSSNEVWDFYQDKEGFLWIATTNGLARYDGYRLQSFRSDYKSAGLLTDNSIVCMSDNDAYVWIGTRKGLNLFDKTSYRILPSPEEILRDKDINGISMGNDGRVWVAAGGIIYKCNSDATLVKAYPLSTNGINSLYHDRKGNLWTLISGEGIFRYDSELDTFINYPHIGQQNVPFTLFQDREDNYWVGTWGEGLWQFYPEQAGEACFEKRPVINSRNGEPDPIFYSLAQDDTFGYLWALSHNELYALKINEKSALEPIDIHDLLDPHMMFTRIFKDQNDNLWLSSYDMAYTIFFDNSSIKNYPLTQIKERLGWDANIVNLCWENDSTMWVEQDRHGLGVYDLHEDKLSANEIKNHSGPFGVQTMIRSDFLDGIWVGTHGEPRVMRLVRRNMEIIVEENVSLHTLTDNPGGIKQLMEDKESNLWTLTSKHLFLRPVNGSLSLTKERSNPSISLLVKDQLGKIWGISNGHNLYRLSRANDNDIACEQISSIPFLSENESIDYACIDSKNNLWSLSSLGRIFRSDSEKKSFQPFSLDKEIEGSSVIGLHADTENVWIITNKKVIQYNTSNEAVYSYSTSDANISVNIFRNKAITQNRSGGIYIGGHGGFSCIHPLGGRITAANDTNPKITDIRLEGESIFFPTSDTERNPANRIDHIYLNAGDRDIEILFSDLQYSSLNAPKRVAYKLEGVDADWIYPEYHPNSASYSQLKKGTYCFWLKSEYDHGKWTDGEIVLTIDQSPAIYETWYASLFYLLAIGLSVLYFAKRRKIKKEIRPEKQQEIQQDDMTAQPADAGNQFLKAITACIMKHMEEPEFDVEKLASEMNMSKSTLHRKIKSITGQTPLDFIRSIKMKQACVLLREKNHNISEIAYSLGFANPKYFSKCFKETFGVTPTEYQQK